MCACLAVSRRMYISLRPSILFHARFVVHLCVCVRIGMVGGHSSVLPLLALFLSKPVNPLPAEGDTTVQRVSSRDEEETETECFHAGTETHAHTAF